MNLVLLRTIDAYLDAAPRTWSRAEVVGPFTLFANDGPGWPIYARPTPGAQAFSPGDVERVCERQRELGVPEALEWVAELAPGLAGAAAAAGLEVILHPLMHLSAADFRPADPPEGAQVAIVPADGDVAAAHGIAVVAFSSPGTAVGPESHDAVAEAMRSLSGTTLEFVRERMERGSTMTVVALAEGRPAAVGTHNPLGATTEIVGVGTLPAFRRRGLGAAVTSLLVQDALGRGIGTVFLSAGDRAIAHVYAGLGFRSIGTAGAARSPGEPSVPS